MKQSGVRVLGALLVACIAALGIQTGTLGSNQPPAATSREYRNPVINSSFPDPDVIRARNGWYYAYATQGKDGHRHLNIQVARSHDLVHWRLLGDALPHLPSWGNKAALSWGPDVVAHSGQYYLYYSIIPNQPLSRSHLCLAVATSRSPAGPFVSTSRPLYCGAVVAVGPHVFRDPANGHWLLYWGSGGQIFTVRLSSSLTRLSVLQRRPKPLLHKAVHRPYERKIESPFVIARHGWYYLFYSGDHCCSYPTNYAIMVARSRRATGPYQRLSATRPGSSSVILHSNHRFTGPGSNSVIRDRAGHDWIAYHAVHTTHPFNPSGRSVRRVMLTDRIIYRKGWPTIATNSPSTSPKSAPQLNWGL